MNILPLAAAAAAAVLLIGCATSNKKPMPETKTATATSQATSTDPFLWLEQTHGERAMAWVKQQNAVTRDKFASGPAFQGTNAAILEVLNSDARIAWPNRMGEYIYNFWKDSAHPRGIWRRTTLASYTSNSPAWETVLDMDALNKAEGKSWVFKGASCLKPDYQRCLIELSPDGGDAVEVREFDTVSKAFVDRGFHLPVAKTQVSWIDIDHLFVGTDFGPGSMTESSYPRIAKLWTRGTPLNKAKTIFEGKPTDLAVSAWHNRTEGFERSFVGVSVDFWHHRLYHYADGKLVQVDVPDDANVSAHRQWLLVETKSPWTIGDTTWPAGALLVTDFDNFMAGKHAFTALFTPDEHTALSSWSWTRHHLIINTLKDVQSHLEVLTPNADGAWQREALTGAPELSTVRIVGTRPDIDDSYWLSVTGFLTPTTLSRGVIGKQAPQAIKQAPAFFDASKFSVSQHFATSKDGTQVPYFEIAPTDLELNSANPTLLYGYGGFEVSLLPSYSGSIGRAWLERGGVYVIANIRGGGEYGPRWHKAALKANRHKAYEDFAAVAQDLIDRNVTSPEHLGAEGGSNGGLLVGNMLVSYPELFGAIVCEVPLLDMKRYIYLDAGSSWIGEYGNPEDPAQWAFIKTFSPYQLVKPGQDYPPALFYTATSDDRVGPAQARKMAARMEHMGYDKVWFFENTEGGHGAGVTHKQSAEMHALAYTFLWKMLQ